MTLLDSLSHSKKQENAPTSILVTGGTGFIGSRLVERLSCDTKQYQILSMSRTNPATIVKKHTDKTSLSNPVTPILADAANYDDIVKALQGVEVAFYLIHSMSGSSKEWRKFEERDRNAAQNFARAATECNVKRIIYLGGLVNPSEQNDPKLSAHMRSRIEVGDILKTSTAKVTIFRAAVIMGYGGGSFEMLRYLVERLPVMVTPKWVLTKSQPIAVDDVVEYLATAIHERNTESRTFDIGGPEILTYIDMMKRYGQLIQRSIRIIIIPFLTPRLSSYWVDLVTPLPASLARPLIDSLKHEATVKDDSIKTIIPLRLKSFEETIRISKRDQAESEEKHTATKVRNRTQVFNNVLLASLIALAIIGSTYYIFDSRAGDIYQPRWITLSAIWYLSIAFAVYFVRQNTKLGATIAGAIGWITLTFWLVDNLYLITGTSLIAQSPSFIVTIRNFVGSIIVGLTIFTAHVVFHELRPKNHK